MMTAAAQRKILIGLVNDLPDDKVPLTIDYILRGIYEADEDEPPLTEDEIRGLEIAKRELAEGKGIPFDEVLKELW